MIADEWAPLMVSIICQFLRLCSVEHNRKNWLFSDSSKGAQASAIVYTMVEMAKAHNLNIYQYLNYVLEHRPSENMSDEKLKAFSPWNPEVIANCTNKN